MTAHLKQRTARIYRFPVKPRIGPGLATDIRMAAGSRCLPSFPAADFGSGWYHEAAIEKESAASHGG